jgi:uncharacterized protein (DUF1786 family)
MIGIVKHGQQRGMDGGVQRLDTSIQNLGKSGDIGNRPYRDSMVAERVKGTARRDHFNAQ